MIAAVRRCLFTFCSALLLLLFVAVSLLGVRSHFVHDGLYRNAVTVGRDRSSFHYRGSLAGSNAGVLSFNVRGYTLRRPSDEPGRSGKSERETYHLEMEIAKVRAGLAPEWTWTTQGASIAPAQFSPATPSLIGRLGFSFTSGRRSDPMREDYGYSLSAPHWFIASSAAVLPAAWLVGTLRRRRPGPGLCPSCGYDLRASPERCPECGRPAEAQP